jgi:hypothetical protein
MHLGHELMEVDATLLFDWGDFKEEVHQHTFAAPNPAIKINTLRRRFWPAKQEPRFARPPVAKPVGQDAQEFDSRGLSRVELD